MSAVIHPTVESLEAERTALVAEARFTERELQERAERHLLTPPEARILRRLEEIRWLLQEGD